MPISNLLFSFEGRIRRLHWWLARLAVSGVLLVIFIVLGGVVGGLAAAGGERSAGVQAAGLLFGLAFLIVIPLTLWIEIALTVKRWHDRDKPGVMVLILFIPLIGGIWTLVECGFMDGTQGPNQYGPSPKGIGETQAQVFA